MKWKNGCEYAKASEYKWEDQFLCTVRYSMLTYCQQIKASCRTFRKTKIINTGNANEHQCRTRHQHQRQLHRAVFFFSCSPDTDQQKLGEHRYFEEKEKHKEVQ